MKQARTIEAIVSAEAFANARRAAGTLANASGRSRADVLKSVMAGEVVGLPTHIARNLSPSFRAELQRATALSMSLRVRR
jgi:hypothetical protein